MSCRKLKIWLTVGCLTACAVFTIPAVAAESVCYTEGPTSLELVSDNRFCPSPNPNGSRFSPIANPNGNQFCPIPNPNGSQFWPIADPNG